jgi:hypothetical protein
LLAAVPADPVDEEDGTAEATAAVPAAPLSLRTIALPAEATSVAPLVGTAAAALTAIIAGRPPTVRTLLL